MPTRPLSDPPADAPAVVRPPMPAARCCPRSRRRALAYLPLSATVALAVLACADAFRGAPIPGPRASSAPHPLRRASSYRQRSRVGVALRSTTTTTTATVATTAAAKKTRPRPTNGAPPLPALSDGDKMQLAAGLRVQRQTRDGGAGTGLVVFDARCTPEDVWRQLAAIERSIILHFSPSAEHEFTL